MNASKQATAAAWYAAHGVPIFPIRPGGKAPLTAHGFRDATCDAGQVREWWVRHPDANIGMPTGASGFDVLDLDHRDGCDADVMRDTLDGLGILAGSVGHATTRNGGHHYFFPASGMPSRSIRALGIDLKAAGGYVLVAPSVVAADRPSGSGAYRWVRWLTPASDARPVDWDGLRARLAPAPPPAAAAPVARRGGTKPDGLLAHVRGASEGNRNRALFWACMRALDDAHPEWLDDLVSAARDAGLTTHEAAQTVGSAMRTHRQAG